MGILDMRILDKAKELLAQNADKVETAITKAGEFVDGKTQGKHSDTIHKVQEEAKKVAKKVSAEDQGQANGDQPN